MPKTINYGRDEVARNHTFIFPAGEKLTGNEIIGFIDQNENHNGRVYRRNMRLYLGKHNILTDDYSAKDVGPDNRIVVNLPKYMVDTYNGFFSGIAPTITLDNSQDNEKLQKWNDTESFFDKLNEISKQVDIYGKSYAFAYQNEDSTTSIAVSDPSGSFIIYDDTVKRKPLAFVRYTIPTNGTISSAIGKIQYADELYTFNGTDISLDTDANQFGKNPYGIVPAIEFYETEERQGVFDSVISLIDELDKAVSQKANQVEYFDNAYFAMIGVQLDQSQLDDDGNPKIDLKNHRLLYLPNVDPNSPNPRLEFVAKPDADQMQENLIERINNWIFQIGMVPNLNDEAFAGNSSGVALNYKLLPMRNKASNKERKFTQSLRKLYQIIFKVLLSDQDEWKNLKFKFTRNLPANIADEVNNAKNAQGMLSQETQLSLMGDIIPDNPQAEIKRINQEKENNIKMALKNSPSASDYDKSELTDDEEENSDEK